MLFSFCISRIVPPSYLILDNHIEQDIWYNKKQKEAMIRGAWFYRTNDIARKTIQKLLGKKRKRDGGDGELFLSNDINTNSSDTVLKRVAVIYADDSEEVKVAKREWAARHRSEVFLCDYFYKTKTRSVRFEEFTQAANKVQEQPQMTADEERKVIEASTWAPNLTDIPDSGPNSLNGESLAHRSGNGHPLDTNSAGGESHFMGRRRKRARRLLILMQATTRFDIWGYILQSRWLLVMKRGDSGMTSKGATSDTKKTSSSGCLWGLRASDWHRKACRMMEDQQHRLGGDSTTSWNCTLFQSVHR